jgi:hypothetical protein
MGRTKGARLVEMKGPRQGPRQGPRRVEMKGTRAPHPRLVESVKTRG